MGKMFRPDSKVMIFLGNVFDLMVLNFLTLLCCLPVITAGASFTAMHYVLFHKVTHDEVGVVRAFFRSFRENLLQATIIWLIFLAGIVAIVMNINIHNVSPESFLGQGISVFLLLPTLVLFMLLMYTFPILSRFANTIPRTLINAFSASIVCFPRTLGMLAVWIAYGFILWNFPLRLMPILILFGFIFPWYICALLYTPVLIRMENAGKAKAEEGTEEAPKAEEAAAQENALESQTPETAGYLPGAEEEPAKDKE